MKDSDWNILYKLSETLNITKAANALYISQPALTKRIQYIEEELDIKIVERGHNGIEFTSAGKYLVEQSKKYMDFMTETKKELENYKETVGEKIILGSSYTYSKYILTGLLYSFSLDYPKISFEIVNDLSDNLFKMVSEGKLDAAFIQNDYKGTPKRVKIDEHICYVVTKNKINLSDLPKMQRITYKTNDITKKIIENWWEKTFDSHIPEGISAGYIDFAFQMIDKGLGYSCCFLSKHFNINYNLTYTPILDKNGKPITRNTYFIYDKNKITNPNLKKFLKYITEKAEKNITK